MLNTEDLLILAKIRSKSYQEILLDQKNLNPNESEFAQLLEFRKKLKNGYPLAYILQKIQFLDSEFTLTDDVLIPRPETEEWVQNLINNFQKKIKPNFNLNIIEIGTGSGVIGLSLWREFNSIVNNILLVDISGLSLAVAGFNLENFQKKYNLKNSPKLEKSNLFSNLKQNQLDIFKSSKLTFNLLVANLPYLPESDIELNPDLKFEPEIALFSGNNGLDLFYKLIEQLKNNNFKFDSVWLELDPRNIDIAKTYILDNFSKNISGLKIHSDFNNHKRVLEFNWNRS